MLYFKKEIIAIALISALEVALAENRELVSVWPNLLPPNHLSFCARSTMWTGLTIARPFRSLFFPRSNKRTTVGEWFCIVLFTDDDGRFVVYTSNAFLTIRFIPFFPCSDKQTTEGECVCILVFTSDDGRLVAYNSNIFLTIERSFHSLFSRVPTNEQQDVSVSVSYFYRWRWQVCCWQFKYIPDNGTFVLFPLFHVPEQTNNSK